MKEVDLQLQIKKSVVNEGGYAFKLSNRFSVGIPDLFIALPPFAPCLVEVKDLKECTPNFNRLLGITPMQRLNLEGASRGYPNGVSFILVGWHQGRDHFLAALPKHAERLADPRRVDGTAYGRREVGGRYGIRALMHCLGITKTLGGTFA